MAGRGDQTLLIEIEARAKETAKAAFAYVRELVRGLGDDVKQADAAMSKLGGGADPLKQRTAGLAAWRKEFSQVVDTVGKGYRTFKSYEGAASVMGYFADSMKKATAATSEFTKLERPVRGLAGVLTDMVRIPQKIAATVASSQSGAAKPLGILDAAIRKVVPSLLAGANAVGAAIGTTIRYGTQFGIKLLDNVTNIFSLRGALGALGTAFSLAGKSIVVLNQGLELLGKGWRFVSGSFKALYGDFLETGSGLLQLSRRLDTSVETLSGLSYAADQAGVDVGSLGTAIQRMSRFLAEAGKEGSKANILLTKGFGLTVDEIQRLQKQDPTKTLVELGQRLEEFEGDSYKAAAAQKIFGQTFGVVQQLSKEGRKEIEQNIAIAKEYGLTWTTESAKAANAVTSGWTRIKAALTGARNRVLNDPQTLTALAELEDAVADGLSEMGKRIAKELGPQFNGTIREAVRSLKEFVDNFKPAESADRMVRLVDDYANSVVRMAAGLRDVAGGVALVWNNMGPILAKAAEGGLVGAVLGALIGLPVGMPVEGAAVGARLGAGFGAFKGFEAAQEEAKIAEGNAQAARDAIASIEQQTSGPLFESRRATAKGAVLASAGGFSQQGDVFAPQSVEAQTGAVASLHFENEKALKSTKGLADALATDTKHSADKAASATRQLAEMIANVDGELRTLDDPTQQAAVEVEKMTRAFQEQIDKGGKASITLAEYTAKVQELVQKRVLGDLATQNRQVGAQVLEMTGQLNAGQAEVLATADRLRAAGVAMPADIAAAQAAVDKFVASAGKTPAEATLALTQMRIELKQQEGAWFSLGDAAEHAFDTISDALVRGTLDWKQVGKSIVTDFSSSILKAMKEGIKHKLGFDKDFKINIVGLMKNLGEIVTGKRGISDVFEGAFEVASGSVSTASKTMAAAVSIVPSAAENAAQMSSEALHTVSKEGVQAAEQLSAAGDTAGQGWFGFFTSILGWAKDTFGQLLSLVLGVVSQILGALGIGGSGTSGGVIGTALNFVTGLLGGGTSSSSGISSGGIISGIYDLAKAAGSVFGVDGIFASAASYVRDFATSHAAPIVNGFKSVFGEGGYISKGFDAVKELLGPQITGIIGKLGNVLSAAGGAFAVYTGIQALINKGNFAQKALGVVETLTGLSTAFDSLQSLLPAFHGFVQSVTDAASTIPSVVGATSEAGATVGVETGLHAGTGLTDFVSALFSHSGLSAAFDGIKGALSGISDLLSPIGTYLSNLAEPLTTAITNGLTSIAGELGVQIGSSAGAELAASGVSAGSEVGASGGSSILGAASGVLAVAGLVYTLYQAGTDIVKTRKAFDKLTLDTAQAQKNYLTAFQSAAIVGGLAGGAVIGTLVSPGLGTIIGAALGAAVGAALGQGVTGGVMSGIAEGRSKGMSNKQLKKAVSAGIDDNIIMKVLNPAGAAGGTAGMVLQGIFNPVGLLLNWIVTALATPNIERIYDKQFRTVLSKSLKRDVPYNTEAPKAGSRFAKGGELNQEGRDATTLVGAVIGAGPENVGRMQRLFAMLSHAVGGSAKTSENIRIDIDKIVRGVTGSLYNAVRIVGAVFGKRDEKLAREQALVARAYQRVLPFDVSGSLAANRKANGQIDMRGLSQDVRADVLERAVRGEEGIDLKKIARRTGDGFVWLVDHLQKRVGEAIDVAAIAVKVNAEGVKHAGRVLLRRVQEARLEAASDAHTSQGTSGTAYSEYEARQLGDALGLAAARLDRLVADSVNTFALALAVAANNVRKHGAALIGQLSAAAKVQSALVLAGLPQLEDDEAADVGKKIALNRRGKRRKKRGRRRTRKLSIIAATAGQSIRAAQESILGQAFGLEDVVASQQAGRSLEAARAGIDQTLTNLPKLKGKKRDEAIQQLPQLAQQAADAVGQLVNSLTSLVGKIKQVDAQLEDWDIQWAETLDGLTGATDTASKYNGVIDLTKAKIDKATTSAERFGAINRVMDLLQKQADARIQDLQDSLAKRTKVWQDRLDDITDRLAIIGPIAQQLDGLKNLKSTLQGVGQAPAQSVERLQRDVVEAVHNVSTADPRDRGAAIGKVQEATTTWVERARELFGTGSGQFESVRRQALAIVTPLLAEAQAADKEAKDLQVEQRDLQDKIKTATEETAAAVESVRKELADNLRPYVEQGKTALEGMRTELLAQLQSILPPGISVQDVLDDPLKGVVAVVSELDQIRQQLLAQAGVDNPGGGNGEKSTTTGPGPTGTKGVGDLPQGAADAWRFLGETKLGLDKVWEWYTTEAEDRIMRARGHQTVVLGQGTQAFKKAAKYFHIAGFDDGGMAPGHMFGLLQKQEVALPLQNPRTIDALGSALARAQEKAPQPAPVVINFRPQVNITLPPGTTPDRVPLFVRAGVRAVSAEFAEEIEVGQIARATRRGGR